MRWSRWWRSASAAGWPVPHLTTTADTRVADRLDNVLLRRVLVDALGTLSAPHQATLVHLHCHDLTQADTARILGVPHWHGEIAPPLRGS